MLFSCLQEWPDDEDDYDVIVKLDRFHKAGRRSQRFGGGVFFSKDGDLMDLNLDDYEAREIIYSPKLRKILNIMRSFGRMELEKEFKGDPCLRFFNKFVIFMHLTPKIKIYFLNNGTVKLTKTYDPDACVDWDPDKAVMPLECLLALIECGERFVSM